jgi:transposase
MDSMSARPANPGTTSRRPDPEVTAKAKRRQFSAQYKLRILREADAMAQIGGIGQLLRREGLYSSHLSTWRRERERGELDGLAAKKRGRRADPDKVLAQENARLAGENARLEQRLAQAEAIIEIQKKVSSILGIPLKRGDDDASGS